MSFKSPTNWDCGEPPLGRFSGRADRPLTPATPSPGGAIPPVCRACRSYDAVANSRRRSAEPFGRAAALAKARGGGRYRPFGLRDLSTVLAAVGASLVRAGA